MLSGRKAPPDSEGIETLFFAGMTSGDTDPSQSPARLRGHRTPEYTDGLKLVQPVAVRRKALPAPGKCKIWRTWGVLRPAFPTHKAFPAPDSEGAQSFQPMLPIH